MTVRPLFRGSVLVSRLANYHPNRFVAFAFLALSYVAPSAAKFEDTLAQVSHVHRPPPPALAKTLTSTDQATCGVRAVRILAFLLRGRCTQDA